MNHAHQRQRLWEDIQAISLQIPRAWTLLGDFNTILHKEDRYGENDVIDNEVREPLTLMEDCELQEITSTGSHYSWTNKNI